MWCLCSVLWSSTLPSVRRQFVLAVREVPAGLFIPEDNPKVSMANFSRKDAGLWVAMYCCAQDDASLEQEGKGPNSDLILSQLYVQSPNALLCSHSLPYGKILLQTDKILTRLKLSPWGKVCVWPNQSLSPKFSSSQDHSPSEIAWGLYGHDLLLPWCEMQEQILTDQVSDPHRREMQLHWLALLCTKTKTRADLSRMLTKGCQNISDHSGQRLKSPLWGLETAQQCW